MRMRGLVGECPRIMKIASWTRDGDFTGEVFWQAQALRMVPWGCDVECSCVAVEVPRWNSCSAL